MNMSRRFRQVALERARSRHRRRPRRAAAAARRSQADGRPAAHQRAPVAPDGLDPVARLQQKIDSGAVALQFDAEHGYLRSLLKDLNIPVSSQVLVFSKSSEQEAAISPQTPRALYFNDDVYVGWVQGGAIEAAAMDPKSGSFFYTLPQDE